jgi:hypothetical protein
LKIEKNPAFKNELEKKLLLKTNQIPLTRLLYYKMVIKLNRKLKQLLLITLFTIPLLVGTLGNSTFVPSDSLEHNSFTQADSQVSGFLNINAKTTGSFDNSAFNNETVINVTREVTVNSWGFTKIVDSVSIATNETSFDEFTYSITPEFYDKVQYIETTLGNDSSSTPVSKSLVMTDELVEITFLIGEIPSDGTITTFEVTTGVIDLVSKNKESLKENPDLPPLKLSGFNFFPWFNFPMTSFEFSMGIDSSDESKNVNNTNYLPAENTFGLTSSIISDENKELRTYSQLTTLPGFNYSSLIQYSNKENNEFIPGFSQLTKETLTIPASFDYSTQFAPMEYVNFEVTMIIDEWGRVQNRERISLKHNGVEGQTLDGQSDSSSFNIYVNAPDILSLEVNDGYTNLSVSQPRGLISKSSWSGGLGQDTDINGTQIRITPRAPISAGSVYTFELIYDVPVESRMQEISGYLSPEWNITTPMSSLFYWPVRNFELTIIFPNWASVSFPDNLWGLNIGPENMTSVPGFLGLSQPALKLKLDKVSYFHNSMATIKMGLPVIIGPFWDVIQNSIFIAILLLLFVVIRIGMQAYSRAVVITTSGEQIPYDLIKDFVINYEEKTALRTRLAELEKRRKNLRKVEYTKLYQTLLNKQNANDRALVKVNSELVKFGPRYRDAIRSIELAEAERDQALESLNDLEKRKKQSRIRPEIYNKLKNEQGKKLRKANSTIERVLVELRSLLTERTS